MKHTTTEFKLYEKDGSYSEEGNRVDMEIMRLLRPYINKYCTDKIGTRLMMGFLLNTITDVVLEKFLGDRDNDNEENTE